MPVKSQDALKLAAWLAHEHPALFRQVAAVAQRSRANLGRLGRLGDVTDTFTDITVDPSLVSSSTSDVVGAVSDSASDTSSGGFWSSLGSALSSAGSAVTGVVGGVANFVGSSQGMATLANLTRTYFQTQAASQQAQAQQAIAQTQIARVQAGISPAPISYTTNPVTGAVTPVYYGSTQPRPVTPTVLQQLQPSGLSQYLPYIAIGAGALLLMVFVSRN